MSARASRYLLVLFAFLIAVPPLAWSQGIGGAISGVVKEEGGTAVTAAVVKLTNEQTGQVRTVSTDSEGRYTIREVPPGSYTVTVERPGFNTAKVDAVRISVAQVARLDEIVLNVTTVGQETVVVVTADVAMTDVNSPTLSTQFDNRQIRELPVLTRDINNLALLAPGVFSVRTFSFASTLVPFAANGSRGRDNNFIIDSVDNNEPLFGGAAAQFTNTDLFAEYRILTNQYKAEYGRNSGSVVNIITERGGNQLRGTAFFFGQHDALNASTRVESLAQLAGTTRFFETQAGATLGGPLRKEKAWFFTSYQWDRARNDLSPLFPLVVTLPLSSGLGALQGFASNPTVGSFLSVPTVTGLPTQGAPCGTVDSNLPLSNPCAIGSVFVRNRAAFNAGTDCSISPTPSGCVPVDFGAFLVPRSGVFDVRDHQFSGRYDMRLSNRDDVYVRYLFDDLRTPRTVGALPAEVGFAEFGLYPEWRISLKQRTQNLGLFWTRAWATALHELRGSFTRISSETGPFDYVNSQVRNTQPAVTVFDNFNLGSNLTGTTGAAQSCPPLTPTAPATTTTDRDCRSDATRRLLSAFPSAGQVLTLGRDTRPTVIHSNIFQLQDNFSWSRGSHGLKIGGNVVRTQSNIRQLPSDLGQYFYLSFDDFVNNDPILGWQRFGNLQGRGGDVLPMREFGKFFFFQDDIRVTSNFTVSLGVRYENYGQALNKPGDLNSGFPGRINRDDSNIAPRIGVAWSPDGKFVIRGGYGIYYNPTPFNIALIAWQGGRISPFVIGFPTNTFPARPFAPSDALTSNATSFGCDLSVLDILVNQLLSTTGEPGISYTDCTTEDRISQNLTNPWVQNYSVSLQRQVTRDTLVEVSYVGSKGRSLFQRLDRNPRQGWVVSGSTANCTVFPNGVGLLPCLRSRQDRNRGGITEVTNGASSNYQALQVAVTQRLSSSWKIPMAITGAYTWSHMIDNASEIFGPGVRFFPSGVRDIVLGLGSAQTVEAITPFPQDSRNPVAGERGNSSFDRRHRVAVSFLAILPTPSSGFAKWVFGNWQINGLFTAQSGQPFTPLNAIAGCADANGDSVLTNDRPLAGNPNAPESAVAVLTNCSTAAGSAAYVRPGTTSPTFSLTEALQNSRFVQAPFNLTGVGSAVTVGRNVLRGPDSINIDMAVFKNFPWGERRNLQVRVEAYNLFNRANPGNVIGNVFASDAQPVPAIAFLPGRTPSRVTGVIPESAIDATDPVPGAAQPSLFLSRRFMNTGARRLQLGVKLIF